MKQLAFFFVMYNILYEFTDTLDMVNIDDTVQFDTCTMSLYVN